MKQLNQILVIMSLMLSTSTIAKDGNVSGGGGGETLPQNPVSPARIYEVVTRAKLGLRLFLKNELYRYGITEIHSPLEQKLFGSQKTLADALETADIEIQMDAPCYNADNKPVDGSIVGVRKGNICISPFSIAPKLIEERAYIETLALILHELTHTIGANEVEANEYQVRAAFLLKGHLESEALELARQNADLAQVIGINIKKLAAMNFNQEAAANLRQLISEQKRRYFELSLPMKWPIMFHDFSEISWFELELVRLSLALIALDETMRYQYERAFNGQREISYENLDWPKHEVRRNPFRNTIVRRLENDSDVKRELLEIGDYFSKEGYRLFQLFVSGSAPALPNYPHLISPNPWRKFVGQYKVTSQKCQYNGIQGPAPDMTFIEIFEERGFIELRRQTKTGLFVDGVYNGGVITPILGEARVFGDDHKVVATSEQGDLWGDQVPWQKKSVSLESSGTGFVFRDTFRYQSRTQSGKWESWSECVLTLDKKID
jgi:hypothetical protein